MIEGKESMSNIKYLEEVESTYIIIDESFDDIYAKCANNKERASLSDLRLAAKVALWETVSSQLQLNSSDLESSLKELQLTNIELKKSLDDLKSVATIINVMEESVRLAAKIAAIMA
jgi:hypothetical protein